VSVKVSTPIESEGKNLAVKNSKFLCKEELQYSAKMQALIEELKILESHKNGAHKSVIFSQFTK
jgi:SNF2 family DNA or RNA helicase